MTQSNEQQAVYCRRFAGTERRRLMVWQVLARNYFHRWVKPTDTVLDLGAGYCEFINSIAAAHKFALDSNPTTREKAACGVTVFAQDAIQPWPLPAGSLDVVFTSNFFEHLPAKADVSACISEAQRVLRPGGRLIALGPNIRYCARHYWDFWDHHLPISDRSMAEALEIAGFRLELVLPRFLPFTISTVIPPWPMLVRLYLAFPPARRLWGRQFLMIARKA